jgi:phytoene dehydrogenase-like protein
MSEHPLNENLPDDEYVPEDDTIIGQAFRWSIAGFLVLGLLIGGIVFWINWDPAVAEEIIAKDPGEIRDLVQDVQHVPPVRFTDITEQAGIEYHRVELPATNQPDVFSRFFLQLFNKIHFKEEKTRAFFYGAAAHATLPLTNVATASFGLVLQATAHKYGWPFPRGGANSIPESLAAYYKSIGGKIFLNTEVSHIDQLPQAKAYLFDLTPRQLLKIEGTKFTQKYRNKMASYRYGQGIFKVDWVLKEPIPFTNPVCRKAGTVHFGYSTKEMEASAAHGHKGYVSPRPYVLLAQHTIFDSTRAPQGMHTAWAYCHVPNGNTTDMTPHIEAQIERAAPGFKDLIVAKHTHNTVQLEAFDPNLVGGDINGGKQDITQLFTRPVARLSPYSTPDKRVYICSSSTPPGGGVHGMCGYNAAVKAFDDHFR